MTEDKLLTTKELATLLGCSEYTIVQYRVHANGPKFFRLGRLIRYRPEDVRAWLMSNIYDAK